MKFIRTLIVLSLLISFFTGLRSVIAQGVIEVRREIVNTLTNPPSRTVNDPLHFAYGAPIDVGVDIPEVAEGSWTVLHIYDSVTFGSNSNDPVGSPGPIIVRANFHGQPATRRFAVFIANELAKFDPNPQGPFGRGILDLNSLIVFSSNTEQQSDAEATAATKFSASISGDLLTPA